MTTDANSSALLDLLTARSGHDTDAPPDELVQVVTRLGFDEYLGSHVVHGFDAATGATRWRVMLITATALVEVTAEASRVIEPYRNGVRQMSDWSTIDSTSRNPKVYTQPPTVSARIWKLESLAGLTVSAMGSTDSWERPEQVRETWTFTFADGSDSVVFEIDHGDNDRPTAVDNLCRHLSGHL